MNRISQFWAVIFFTLLSAAPFVVVAMSLYQLRSALLFDQVIQWNVGNQSKITLPDMKAGAYELRMESMESSWEPIVRLTWSLENNLSGKKIAETLEPMEVSLMRPLGKFKLSDNLEGANVLSIQFFNSNPQPDRVLRLKLASDRDLLLEKSANLFLLVLVISLALSLFLWKPLMAKPQPNS